MFAKTFDIVYENATQEYLFSFAERTIEWRNAPKFPPPLNVVVDLLRTVQWVLGKLGCPCVNHLFQPEQTDSKPFDLNSCLDFLEPKLTREEWIKRVLEDFEENSDFGSDSQMEKFKSTILKRSKKLESVLEQQVTQAKTLQSLELKLESIKGSQEKKLETLESVLEQQVNLQSLAVTQVTTLESLAKKLESLELKLESVKGSQEKKLESLEAMLLKQQEMLQQLLTNHEVRKGSIPRDRD
jgi:hypothetical protein